MKGAAETTFTRQPDGFILAGIGNKQPDTYSIESRPRVRRIAALRLDVAPHASLPNAGSGHFYGNFHFTEFRARVRRADGVETSLKLNRAAADHVRHLDSFTTLTDGPWGVLDDRKSSRWDISPVQTQPHWLVLVPDMPWDIAENDTLVVDHDSGDWGVPSAQLGHFRLSVSEDLRAGLADELIVAVRKNELQSTELLAAACLINGEAQLALNVLEQAPQTKSHDGLLRALLTATSQHQLGLREVAQQTVKVPVAESSFDPWPHSLTGYYRLALHKFADLPFDDVVNRRESRAAELESREIERELVRLTRLIEANPNDSPSLEARAYSRMRLGRWREAAEDWASMRKRTPNARLIWFAEANCRLLAGEDAAYKQLCQNMLNQFRGTTDAEIADSLTKT